MSIIDMAENHQHLRAGDDISVEPMNTFDKVQEGSFTYLIMGPTGSGKSSFIEALAAESQNLSISKDQLDGYTQRITSYCLVNVTFNDKPIYLIDTPGFSDNKISELEIMDMVQKWLKFNGLSFVDTVLYLMPITAPRLSGSKWRTIQMLRTLLKSSRDVHSIIFVTTMWNQVRHNRRIEQRAFANLTQLRVEPQSNPALINSG